MVNTVCYITLNYTVELVPFSGDYSIKTWGKNLITWDWGGLLLF